MTDNAFWWIFEKIFDQMTRGQTFYQEPFAKTFKKIFDNDKIHQLVARLAHYDPKFVKMSLTDRSKIKKFLMGKYWNRINVAILLGEEDNAFNLLQKGYRANTDSLKLSLVNCCTRLLDSLLDKKSMSGELLSLAAREGYEDVYFRLREYGLRPNIHVYQQAVLGGSLRILEDVSRIIGVSHRTLELAFQMNSRDNILFLLERAAEEGVRITPKMIGYVLLNDNLELLEILEARGWISRDPELYYDAILSGSMRMVRWIENKIPNVHEHLDRAHSAVGQRSILLDESVYLKNGKRYFSHCINYAVQSRSEEMLRYLLNLGYGVTFSNIVTALRQSTTTMLQILLRVYPWKIPVHILLYLGPRSYLEDKIGKIRTLHDSGKLCLELPKRVQDRRRLEVHYEIIHKTDTIPEDLIDEDHLMNYALLLNLKDPLEYLRASIVRYRLTIGLDLQIIPTQAEVDTIYLYGCVEDIKRYLSRNIPGHAIMMELVCQRQLEKIAYLLVQRLIKPADLWPLVTVLNDPELLQMFGQYGLDPEPRYLVASGDTRLVIRVIQKGCLNKQMIKKIILLDDLELIRQIPWRLHLQNLDEYIDWAEDHDLREISAYLKSVKNLE